MFMFLIGSIYLILCQSVLQLKHMGHKKSVNAARPPWTRLGRQQTILNVYTISLCL